LGKSTGEDKKIITNVANTENEKKKKKKREEKIIN
jgi:hypothetical protein